MFLLNIALHVLIEVPVYFSICFLSFHVVFWFRFVLGFQFGFGMEARCVGDFVFLCVLARYGI